MFEKRLITKYIDEHGTCPVTGEALTVDDLMPVKSQGTNNSVANGVPQTVKAPRPVGATSIPGMLQMFQNEWDSLMLETYTLKQHLDTVRQELSHALYQHDAACRVIARLIKERDDARMALANAKANMEIEQDGITQDVIKKMTTVSDRYYFYLFIYTISRLSAKRKKRKISPTLAPIESLKTFKQVGATPLHKTTAPGITSVDVSAVNHKLLLTGGVDGDALIFNSETSKVLATLSAHQKQVNQVLFHPTLDVVFTASADHTARVWTMNEKGEYKTAHLLKNHTADVTGIALQASGDYLVSSSLDGTWSFYDIASGACLSQSDAAEGLSCASFHPDGLILGTGNVAGAIKIWDVKSQQNVASFTGHNGKVTSLSFSENGYYLASSAQDSTVKLWDLRKLTNFHTIKMDAANVGRVRFDYSGIYLGIAAENTVAVYQSKTWNEVCKLGDYRSPATDIIFGTDAQYIATTSLDRHLRVFSL